MEKQLEQLFRKYDELLSSQKFIPQDLDYSILDLHIPFLEKINQLNSSLVTIYDMYKKRHIYTSKSYSPIFSLYVKASENTDSTNSEHIHPKDFFKLMEAGVYFLKYGFSLSVEDRHDGKLVNEYRILTEGGKYIKVIEQQMCLKSDIHGNVWLALSIMDISPEQELDSPFRSRLVNTKTSEVFMFPPPNKEKMLSSREQEIIKLISEGLVSKEIADKLFISINTVNTHRQRIIEKLKVTNTAEAVRYASEVGWLKL
jgi:DNA-binding CsgD family transcriptional regulator